MYVVVPVFAVLMVDGLHVPAIPSVDVAGSAGATLFWQKGPIGLITGFTIGSMLMIMVTIRPH